MNALHLSDNRLMDFVILDEKSIMEHSHQHLELIYILEGEAEVIVNGISFLLKREDFIVVNSKEIHSVAMTKAGLWGCLAMHYHVVNQYGELFENEIHCNSALYKNEKNEEVKKILRGFVSNYYNKDSKEAIRLNVYYYQLLYLLCTDFLFRKKDVGRLHGNEDENRLHKIMSYINDNYYNVITLEELSKETYFSAAYLSKYIKKKTGENFVNVLTKVRLKHALNDMMYTPKTFMKIALDNGFPNTVAFNKAFKKAYKVTPSEYRRKMRQSKAGDEAEEEAVDLSLRIQNYLTGQEGKNRETEENIHRIIVNAADGKLYKKNWCLMINGGLAKDLLRGDMQRHILLLKEQLGFSYVRFWDIYAPEMFLYNQDISKKYNFSKLSAILDFLKENGLKPYIEMGFKPLRLLKNIDLYMLAEERENIFANQEEYRDFLVQLLKHCVNRYGMHVVEEWYFEQWKDPREADLEAYFETFETAYTTIKSFSSNIRVGGAGLNRDEGYYFTEVVSQWKQRSYCPDFLSLYSYPYDPEDYDMISGERTRYNYRHSREQKYMRNYIEYARKILFESGFMIPEIHISEWNFTVSNRNCFNDSAFKGAYIVKNLIDTVEKVDLVGYWMGSDLFTEFYDTNFLLDGSCGLLSKDGIRKPAFYGISFMNYLEDYLLGKGEHSIVTTDLKNTYSIVCHNYAHFNYKYFAVKEDEITIEEQENLLEGESIKCHFRIRDVKNGKYLIKTRSMNEENGSVQAEWKRMGMTENLSSQDIAYLKQISVPRISILTYEVTANELEIETMLKINEIQHIDIIYQMQ